MPARSKVQRRAAAIAQHHPEQLHARNQGMRSMSLGELAKLAGTPERGLPARVKTPKKRRRT